GDLGASGIEAGQDRPRDPPPPPEQRDGGAPPEPPRSGMSGLPAREARPLSRGPQPGDYEARSRRRNTPSPSPPPPGGPHPPARRRPEWRHALAGKRARTALSSSTGIPERSSRPPGAARAVSAPASGSISAGSMFAATRENRPSTASTGPARSETRAPKEWRERFSRATKTASSSVSRPTARLAPSPAAARGGTPDPAPPSRARPPSHRWACGRA